MRILFINSDGAGFAEHREVAEGVTFPTLFAEAMPGRKAGEFLIRVNRQPATADQVLQPDGSPGRRTKLRGVPDGSINSSSLVGSGGGEVTAEGALQPDPTTTPPTPGHSSASPNIVPAASAPTPRSPSSSTGRSPADAARSRAPSG